MEFNATFLASAISFIIFTLVMNKVLYKPLSDIVQKREEYLSANENAAKANLKSVDDIKADKEQKVAASRSDAKNMIFQEIENSKKSKSDQEIEKKKETSKKLSEHKNQLLSEKEQLSGQIGEKTGELSEAIVEKLLGFSSNGNTEVENG